MIIHGPGLINLHAESVSGPQENTEGTTVTIRLHLQPVDIDLPISLTAELPWVGVRSEPNSTEVRWWERK